MIPAISFDLPTWQWAGWLASAVFSTAMYASVSECVHKNNVPANRLSRAVVTYCDALACLTATCAVVCIVGLGYSLM